MSFLLIVYNMIIKLSCNINGEVYFCVLKFCDDFFQLVQKKKKLLEVLNYVYASAQLAIICLT